MFSNSHFEDQTSKLHVFHGLKQKKTIGSKLLLIVCFLFSNFGFVSFFCKQVRRLIGLVLLMFLLISSELVDKVDMVCV